MEHFSLPSPQPPDGDRIVVTVRGRRREPSILRLMVEKGQVTLSIDRALWAVAGIIAALRVPETLAVLLAFLERQS